ncbi:hypothetical protein APA_4500 [Pseudanabaena sp. lw0831]|nr:hypothetical protein APA_4500 [Pseudanabaena sp. lw0831]
MAALCALPSLLGGDPQNGAAILNFYINYYDILLKITGKQSGLIYFAFFKLAKLKFHD